MYEIALVFAGLVVGFMVAMIHMTSKPEREILVKAVVSDFFGEASPRQVLMHLENAAWEARMAGGCHTPCSEVLTNWSKHLRAILPNQEGHA